MNSIARSATAPPAMILATILAVSFAVPAAAGRKSPAAPQAAPRVAITIGLQVVEAEVADTEARKRQGLSGRAHLGAGHGMWFPYEVAGRPSFWMKDMRIALDFVWIRNGRIVDLTPNISPDGGTRTLVRPRVAATGALEVPAGTIARWGWKVGDAVRITPLEPASP